MHIEQFKNMPFPSVDEIPDSLLRVPGVLQEAVDYYRQTDNQDQPILAVSTAIAFGSVVCGRYWKSENNNFTALWILNVGDSGAGKDHIYGTLVRLLQLSGLHDRIMGDSYTSPAAIFGALEQSPVHLTPLDEIGRLLSVIKASREGHQMNMVRVLMSAFSKVDKILIETAYSRKVSSVEPVRICRPSISLMGMTTEHDLFEGLDPKAVNDGFLNRFLPFITSGKWQATNIWRSTPCEPPESLIQWAKEVSVAAENPRIIPFSPESRAVFEDFARQVGSYSRDTEKEGYSGYWKRAVEISMRLATIAAISLNHIQPTIDRVAAQWATALTEAALHTFYHRFVRRLGDTELARLCDKVLTYLKTRGADGVTAAMLTMQRPTKGPLCGVDDRTVEAVLRRLSQNSEAAYVITYSGRGPNKKRWYATEFAPQRQ